MQNAFSPLDLDLNIGPSRHLMQSGGKAWEKLAWKVLCPPEKIRQSIWIDEDHVPPLIPAAGPPPPNKERPR